MHSSIDVVFVCWQILTSTSDPKAPISLVLRLRWGNQRFMSLNKEALGKIWRAFF